MARKATAYAPGLLVSPRTRHRVRRILPIPGEVLVRVGDRVEAQQVVAQTFIPGPVTPINISKMLSMPALILGGLCTYFYVLVRHARRAAAAEEAQRQAAAAAPGMP